MFAKVQHESPVSTFTPRPSPGPAPPGFPGVREHQGVGRRAGWRRLPVIWRSEAHCRARVADDLPVPVLGQRREPRILWHRSGRSVSACVGICRSHSQGCKASELPVQLPTRFELAVNLKTATALELTIPESFLLL